MPRCNRPVVFHCLLLTVFAFSNLAAADRTTAFPGAQGFGKYAEGGRGGVVYHVTNLNDSGPGSLRMGIETAASPTTIVFDVAGTIILKSSLILENTNYMTIAGQTAPGKGITLRDHNFSIKNCKHIVIRYLRVRLGDKNKPQGSAPDVMTVNYNNHLILDHLSLSWGIDGNSDYRGNKNMTLQWLIYSEALNRSLHGKGAHAMATSLRDCAGNTTVHHNIYSTSRNRHPTLGSGVKKDGANWIVDFRNCVNYNWAGPTNLGGLQMNVVGNYYRPGPCTRDLAKRPMQLKDHDTTRARGYAADNFFDGMNEKFNKDNYSAIEYRNSGSYMSTTRERWESKSEFDCGVYAIETQSSVEAYAACLQSAGCSLVRDDVDLRTIANIRSRRGTLIDSQDEVGGWDDYTMTKRPTGWDQDRDGMADDWERDNGLNPMDSFDRNGDKNGNGVSDLEDYLNSLCLGSNNLISK